MVPSTELDGDYDYIVVGAGSAGCVVANRLSTDRNNRVLVLEAGGNDNWIWFHIPVGYLFAIGNPRSDWMFETVSEAGLNGRSLKYPRGKVVGGSSAINAMISMRGQASDYDHWRQLGLTGWGWDDVRPVFKRLDDHFLGESEHHGVGGEWRVEPPGVRWDVLDSVAKAAVEMGIPMTPDFNTGDNTGVGYFHVNQKRGFRWSSARGFLKPVLHRANLRLETGVLVEKVLFDGQRAVGVRYRQHGRTVEVRAKGEVILSAGSIGSPEILQRSGVGPAEWLGEFGITTVANRPGVGRNLQDHLQQRAIYRVQGTKTLNETYHSLIGRALMGLEYALFRRGPLTMAPSQLGIFTTSSPDFDRANIQFHVQPLSLDRFGDPLHRFPAITVSACNLRPTSRGTVRLALRGPFGETCHRTELSFNRRGSTCRSRCDPGHSPFDEAEGASPLLPRGVSFQGHRSMTAKPLLPRPPAISGRRSFILSAQRKWDWSTIPLAVVDQHLRVIGLDGLRVIDASVMPTITSGNTNTPTIMIADKGAQYVLSDAQYKLV